MIGLVIYRFTPLVQSLWRRCQGLPEEQPAAAPQLPRAINRNTLEVHESVLVAADSLLVRTSGQIRKGYLDRIGIGAAPRPAPGRYGAAAAYQASQRGAGGNE